MLSQPSPEKDIPERYAFESLQAALLTAYRKEFW